MDANKKDTVIADVKGRFKKLEKEGKALAKSCTKPSPAEVKRTVCSISWYPDGGKKLAVAFAIMQFQVRVRV